jgi:hypothetical protein
VRGRLDVAYSLQLIDCCSWSVIEGSTLANITENRNLLIAQAILWDRGGFRIHGLAFGVDYFEVRMRWVNTALTTVLRFLRRNIFRLHAQPFNSFLSVTNVVWNLIRVLGTRTLFAIRASRGMNRHPCGRSPQAKKVTLTKASGTN